MKATELRIGNYIALPSRNEDCVIIKGLDNDFVWCDATTNEWSIDDYKPIPLTEEWLLKFGFVNLVLKLNKTYQLRIDEETHYQRSIYLENIRASIPLLTPIKYVHQLQNIFHALTGEELTVKE